MFKRLRQDIAVIKSRDPAAKSSAQVLLLYNGLHAVIFYRISHRLYKWGRYFLARWVSQYAKFRTGVEIHPAARIGKGLFIDHGTGVVIGETAEIGDNCVIYQGVTLGGTGHEQGKRHPTLGDNVMVGSGAKVLGPVKIGNNSKIAANAVVLCDLPADCTAVGVPARVVRIGGKKVEKATDLDQIHIPDPVAQELCRLEARIQTLEKHLSGQGEKNKK